MPEVFFCLLGSTPELSLLELQALYGKDQVTMVAPDICTVELESTEAGQQLQKQTGGVVKVCQLVTAYPTLDITQLEAHLATHLEDATVTKALDFSVTVIGTLLATPDADPEEARDR